MNICADEMVMTEIPRHSKSSRMRIHGHDHHDSYHHPDHHNAGGGGFGHDPEDRKLSRSHHQDFRFSLEGSG